MQPQARSAHRRESGRCRGRSQAARGRGSRAQCSTNGVTTVSSVMSSGAQGRTGVSRVRGSRRPRRLRGFSSCRRWSPPASGEPFAEDGREFGPGVRGIGSQCGAFAGAGAAQVGRAHRTGTQTSRSTSIAASPAAMVRQRGCDHDPSSTTLSPSASNERARSTSVCVCAIADARGVQTLIEWRIGTRVWCETGELLADHVAAQHDPSELLADRFGERRLARSRRPTHEHQSHTSRLEMIVRESKQGTRFGRGVPIALYVPQACDLGAHVAAVGDVHVLEGARPGVVARRRGTDRGTHG